LAASGEEMLSDPFVTVGEFWHLGSSLARRWLSYR
jgi:hypothetical protein